MKKIISILLTVLLMSETAFAVSDSDLAYFRSNNYKMYETIIDDAFTITGERVVDSIDTTKIIPYYWLQNNGIDVFKNYTEGNFSKEFQDEVFSFFCISKDSDNNIIEIGKKYDKATDSYIFTEVEDFWNPEFAFDDRKIEELLNDAGVTTITDFRISDVSYLSTGLFLYLNTDKGEFIKLWRDLDRNVVGKTPLSSKILYSADDFVEYCLDAIEIDKMNSQSDYTNGETVSVGDDIVEITPEPRIAENPQSEMIETPKASPQPEKEPKSANSSLQDAKKNLTVKNDEHIIIGINQNIVGFPDAQPFIDENNRTQIPVRAVAEMLGCTVDWNGEAKTVTITHKNGDTVRLTIDSNIMTVNGKSVQMDTAAIIKDERTYIPVRFVAEAMGLTVEWVQ